VVDQREETEMTVTTSLPANKTELLAYTTESWRSLAEFADALTDAQWTAPVDAGGWAVKDHIAHFVFWVRAEIAVMQHRTPLEQSAGIPDALWNTGDFDQINDYVRQGFANETPTTIRAERDRVFAQLIKVVGKFSDEDLERPATTFGFEEEGKTLLTVLTEYHGDHFREHAGYVRMLVAQA
jgi:hypothetical protein